MTHFELLGLAPAFNLDLAALETAYFKAQRQYHPDRFVTKSPEERLRAASASADINKAYDTLKHPLKRAQYLLHLQGITVGTDHDSTKPSQATLIEAMELRETPKTPDALQQMINDSTNRIASFFAQSSFDEMAQETLRLGYILKIRGL